MHKDPDRESPAINSSSLEWNEPLNVMSTKGRWIEVERQNGDKGWIYNGNTSGTPFLKEPRSNIGIKAGGATASTGARINALFIAAINEEHNKCAMQQSSILIPKPVTKHIS